MKTDPVSELELVTTAVAPRVTNEDVEANIVAEFYFTAGDGVMGSGTTPTKAQRQVGLGPLDLLTICVLVLKNGFTVLGQSACASPENFNPEIGNRLAREDAKNKIWAFMGYELRTLLVPLDQRPVLSGNSGERGGAEGPEGSEATRDGPQAADLSRREEYLGEGEKSVAEALEDAAKRQAIDPPSYYGVERL